MKSLLRSFLKTALLLAALALCFGGSIIAQAGGKHPLSPAPTGPGNLAYRTESPQGYLEVYSATDEFNDGGLAYYPHSSYAIYTTDGKLFKTVENHISLNDESPDLVALPTGFYLVMARFDRHGDVSIRVVIKAGRRTVIDLDAEKAPAGRTAL
ncbi:MAG: hypothetical protein ACREIW_05420 [Chthoniobacterales bacterium]